MYKVWVKKNGDSGTFLYLLLKAFKQSMQALVDRILLQNMKVIIAYLELCSVNRRRILRSVIQSENLINAISH